MKKTYETPEAEKVEFQYSEQVVASSCEAIYINTGDLVDGVCDKSELYKPMNT